METHQPHPVITPRLAIAALLASAVACLALYDALGERGLLLAPIVGGLVILLAEWVRRRWFGFDPDLMQLMQREVERDLAARREEALTEGDHIDAATARARRRRALTEAALERRRRRKAQPGARDITEGTTSPNIGDTVELKVGGGKYEVGTKGRVVDVFSAGVIVELSDEEGHTTTIPLPDDAVAEVDAD